MMNVRRGLILLIVAFVLVEPGCRSRTRRRTAPTTTPTATMTDVAPPDVPTVVETPSEDFVQESVDVRAEDLPADVSVLNVTAQERGWIRDVFFDYDSSSLSPDGQDALAVTASWLKSHPEYSLLIEGHCDERGTQQYNLALGDRRANIAREYLATLGVDDRLLRTVSYGEERPFSNGSSEEAWRQNRRAHLVLVKQ